MSHELFFNVRLMDVSNQPIPDDENKKLIRVLRKSYDVRDLIDEFGCGNQWGDWDTYDEDLKVMSTLHRDVVWRIDWFGDGGDDRGAAWYLNGGRVKEWVPDLEIPPYRRPVMNESELGRRITAINHKAWDMWRELIEDMPNDWTMILPKHSCNWGSWTRSLDGLAELCGRIYDKGENKTAYSRGSMQKKLRKVLGYSYP